MIKQLPMQYFNIQVASQLSGVASATIRAWEKRYHAVVPERAQNKHRLYSEQDIEKLTILAKLTEYGQSIGKVAHLNFEELKHIYCTLLHRPYEHKLVTPHLGKNDYAKILSSFYFALTTFKLDIISHELNKAREQLTPRELCLNLLVPLLKETKEKVIRQELSVAQEYILRTIFAFQIGHMVDEHYQHSHDVRPAILLCTPLGEFNEIQAMASALLCIHYGIHFITLGPSISAEALNEVANEIRPKAILIAVTGSHSGLNEYVMKVQQGLNANINVWINGSGEQAYRNITHFPSLNSLDAFLAKPQS